MRALPERSRNRLLLGLSLFTLVTAGALAGCAAPEEADDGDGDGNVTSPDPNATDGDDGTTDGNVTEYMVWRESFGVPENATALNLTLTITPLEDNITNATARIIGPDGQVAAEEEVEWEAGANETNVTLTVRFDGAGSNVTGTGDNATGTDDNVTGTDDNATGTDENATGTDDGTTGGNATADDQDWQYTVHAPDRFLVSAQWDFEGVPEEA